VKSASPSETARARKRRLRKRWEVLLVAGYGVSTVEVIGTRPSRKKISRPLQAGALPFQGVGGAFRPTSTEHSSGGALIRSARRQPQAGRCIEGGE